MKDYSSIKKELRKERRAARNGLSLEARQKAAGDCLRKLRAMEAYQETDWIYAYLSYLSELPTEGIIKQAILDGKRVAVPKVLGDIMKFYEIKSLEECVSGAYGILEPKGDTREIEEKGLMLLPGLAFDAGNHRMGYGGGFYDKYLSCHEGITTYALGYDIQLIEQVPCEEHDMVLDGLILGSTR